VIRDFPQWRNNSTWHSRVNVTVYRYRCSWDRFARLPCIRTHAITALSPQLTAKDSFAYPKRLLGSVQSARAMSASALRLRCSQLSLRGRCSGPDPKLVGSWCSTDVVHRRSGSYWCLAGFLDPLEVTATCNARIVDIWRRNERCLRRFGLPICRACEH